MNLHPHFKLYFEDVAKRLRLLGQQPGKINLAFVEGPEQSALLLNLLKTKVCYPLLLVEFEDQDDESAETGVHTLHSAIVVVDVANTSQESQADIEATIYARCKPAADQIMARMRSQSDRMELKLDGKQVSLVGVKVGNWIGKMNNNQYGWRVAFTWRIAGSTCVDPGAWDSAI